MQINYKILFYKKENGTEPVKEFLLTLPLKHKAKALREIDLLAEFGTQLKAPHVTKIEGDKYGGLWELRIKFASDISRIFYFMPEGNTFILLHGYLKKTDKTPKKELKTAKKYIDNYKKE